MKKEMQVNKADDYLKVIYEQKQGKLFPLDGLTYDKFINRLEQVYKLPPIHSSHFYHLYWIDSDKDNITIRCQEDFKTFLDIPGKKKLYLTHTSDQDLHFQQQPSQQQKPMMKQAEIEGMINAKKQQLLAKMHLQLSNLKESLIKKMHMQIDNNIVIAVHDEIKCQKCNNGQFIVGTRYQCIICDYNICENCEINDDHPHPLFKILNESQSISVKKNMILLEQNNQNSLKNSSKKQSKSSSANDQVKIKAKKSQQISPSKNQVKPKAKRQEYASPSVKKKPMPQFYEQFKAITNLSDQKAQAIISSHPKMNLQQLIQYFFSTQ